MEAIRNAFNQAMKAQAAAAAAARLTGAHCLAVAS